MSGIDKNLLEKLYLKNKLSCKEISKKLNIKSSEKIRYYLKKYNINRRNKSEISTKYPKINFSGNLNEKSYMLGLRSGDISAEKNHRMVRVRTTTTHVAQVEMFKNTFEKYTHVHVYSAWNKDHLEWRLYCDLNSSFIFLLDKIKKIPIWILNNKENFYSFLTGYMDCEGSWGIGRNNKNNLRFSFRIRTSDKTILVQLLEKLEKFNYKTNFYIEKSKGSTTNKGKLHRDFYCLSLLQRKYVVKIAKKLITLSKHKEKIIKMQLIIGESENKYWDSVRLKVLKLRNEIKKEHIKNFGVDFHSHKRCYNNGRKNNSKIEIFKI